MLSTSNINKSQKVLQKTLSTVIELIMDQMNLIKEPLAWILLLLGIIVYIFFQRLRLPRTISAPHSYSPKSHITALTKASNPRSFPSPFSSPTKQKAEAIYSEAAYDNIIPLPNFSLDTEPPLKLRPFKPKFHMTMGTVSATTYKDFERVLTTIIYQLWKMLPYPT